VPQENNHVHLTYRGPDKRDEILVGLVPPVDLQHGSLALGADHLLVNLTSGRDIELETLRALRARFAGVQQLDVHSLTLDIAPGGLRVLRRPEDWQSWARCADWVQMNETEADLLGDGSPAEEFAAQVLELGPRGVLITLGARGCLARWREGSGTRTLALEAEQHPVVPYATGCGDVFGASFAYALISQASIENAVRLANALASIKACFEPYSELAELRRRGAPSLARYLPG
jgi:sugar/nucleoside kinase (ribokinase family)